ncbi:carboxy-S-adenosyl-L-methionine synthase CmoA [Spirochaeta lutea]|uniref:Carboxy-S-adenosyl-L-methionine synthase n=1 Tax=Spirochaeta lutea TaxID=1480694 RepID=A0A098R093_9SPIO|nr:carboxy-S-adenosyl-L-methionine synthase CmoA [Spirochaeta lutea]KGE73324.1 tRNA methyltransferase [Spirochaeta lutea]
MKDRIYARAEGPPEPFRFDDRVARVFPDMIKRSVPGYESILESIGQFTRRFAQDGTRCYDLGCSLGASTLAIRHNLLAKDASIVAVDNSPAMVERCRRVMDGDPSLAPVEVRRENIQDTPLGNASVVVLNFTLQFVAPQDRPELLGRIRSALVPGGVLILSEKIGFSDPEEQQMITDLHVDFKRRNGYSDLEIAQKRQALENVLVPWTAQEHRDALAEAGFGFVTQWYGWFQFVSFLAQRR